MSYDILDIDLIRLLNSYKVTMEIIPEEDMDCLRVRFKKEVNDNSILFQKYRKD